MARPAASVFLHLPICYMQPRYREEVARAQQLFQLPQDYFALHLRWMENKCRSHAFVGTLVPANKA